MGRPGSARVSSRIRSVALAVLLVAALLVPALPAAAAAAALSGTVTSSETGLPIEGVTVVLYDKYYDYVGEATTNASGVYQFATLPGNGTYGLDFLAHGYGYDWDSVTYMGTPVTLNMGLAPLPPVVTGTVTDAVSHDPVEGAEVDAYVRWGGYYEWVGSALTDDQGDYTVYDEWYAGAGDYDVMVSGWSYLVAEKPIEWDGTNIVTLDFQLEGAVPIATGTVTDFDSGLPIEDAMVFAFQWDPIEEWFDWTGYAWTDDAGDYTVYDQWELGAGEYDLDAWALGYRYQSVTRDWDGAELLTQNYALEVWSLDVIDVAGNTRYETAVEASKLAFAKDGSCDAVVVASGRNFPDALGGAALAGAVNGPVLLTAPAALPGAVAAEIERLGATQVFVVGGDAAVSEDVETALADLPGVVDVERIGGQNRYETAADIAQRTVEILGMDYPGDIMFATGTNFPDALAAGPLATQGVPILLVRPTSIPAETLAALDEIEPDYGIVLGGTGAVSGSVYSQLRTRLGGAGTITRLWGGSRYETAAEIARYGIYNYGLDPYGVGLATGTNYPDALAGGTAQGLTGTVLLLTRTNSLDWATADALAEWAWEIWELRFFGGTGAISEYVRSEAQLLLEEYGAIR